MIALALLKEYRLRRYSTPFVEGRAGVGERQLRLEAQGPSDID